eukprot:scaffold88600_cov69-Phaeocystis_antarctica.AAC.2
MKTPYYLLYHSWYGWNSTVTAQTKVLRPHLNAISTCVTSCIRVTSCKRPNSGHLLGAGKRLRGVVDRSGFCHHRLVDQLDPQERADVWRRRGVCGLQAHYLLAQDRTNAAVRIQGGEPWSSRSVVEKPPDSPRREVAAHTIGQRCPATLFDRRNEVRVHAGRALARENLRKPFVPRGPQLVVPYVALVRDERLDKEVVHSSWKSLAHAHRVDALARHGAIEAQDALRRDCARGGEQDV